MNEIIANTIEREGGYVNHPDDRGGATKHGITQRLARKYGYENDMKDLAKCEAQDIYKKEFWDKIQLDELKNENMKEFIFDAAVNHGHSWGVRIAQRAYNALNVQTIVEDGLIGPQTINALNDEEYQQDLCFWYIMVRGKLFYDIARGNNTQKSFIRGWGNRLEKLLLKIIEEE